MTNVDSSPSSEQLLVRKSDSRTISSSTEQGVLVAYRSIGLGIWGATLRFCGMPLEKIALEANSGRVSHIPGGPSELRQALRQVAQRGWADPWKVVTPRSMWAWFVQYGLMGLAFQTLDLSLSRAMGVSPQIFGKQIFETDVEEVRHPSSATSSVLFVFKSITAPFLASVAESVVANKAEVTRYLGPSTLNSLQARTVDRSILGRIYGACGPAFVPNVARNFVMSSTSFVITPMVFHRLPQEHRTPQNLFFLGLALNMGPGNSLAITMQSLWGRSLDHLNHATLSNQSAAHSAFASNQMVNYRHVVTSSWQQHGYRAFFTPTKLFTRVLMNTPAQGTIPWFANVILPKWEGRVLDCVDGLVMKLRGTTRQAN